MKGGALLDAQHWATKKKCPVSVAALTGQAEPRQTKMNQLCAYYSTELDGPQGGIPCLQA